MGTGGINDHPDKSQLPKSPELPVLVAGTGLNFSKLLDGICVNAGSSSCLHFLPILAEEMVHSVVTEPQRFCTPLFSSLFTL